MLSFVHNSAAMLLACPCQSDLHNLCLHCMRCPAAHVLFQDVSVEVTKAASA